MNPRHIDVVRTRRAADGTVLDTRHESWHRKSPAARLLLGASELNSAWRLTLDYVDGEVWVYELAR